MNHTFTVMNVRTIDNCAVELAQSVERKTFNLVAVGSTPTFDTGQPTLR